MIFLYGSRQSSAMLSPFSWLSALVPRGTGSAIEESCQFVGIPESRLPPRAVEGLHETGDLLVIFRIHPVEADDIALRR